MSDDRFPMLLPPARYSDWCYVDDAGLEWYAEHPGPYFVQFDLEGQGWLHKLPESEIETCPPNEANDSSTTIWLRLLWIPEAQK